jgi:hypothetical protein
MKNWKLFVGVTMVFVLGILVGVMGTSAVIKKRHPLFTTDVDSRTRLIVEKLDRELGLDDDQRKRVETVVNAIGRDARDHFRRSRKQWEALVDRGFRQIRQELSPGQREKLETIRHTFEKRRRRWEARWAESRRNGAKGSE